MRMSVVRPNLRLFRDRDNTFYRSLTGPAFAVLSALEPATVARMKDGLCGSLAEPSFATGYAPEPATVLRLKISLLYFLSGRTSPGRRMWKIRNGAPYERNRD